MGGEGGGLLGGFAGQWAARAEVVVHGDASGLSVNEVSGDSPASNPLVLAWNP